MKILVISLNSPEISIGGVERYIANLFDFFQDKPHEVIFLLPSNGKDSYEKRNNITIYRKNFLTVPYRKRFGKKKIFKSKLKKKSKDFFGFLLNLFNNEKVDIVSAQNFHGAPPSHSIVLNMACFAKSVPLILRIHSYAQKDIEKAIINSLFWKKIICVSKSVAGDCFNKGVDVHKLTTKYLGINTRKFRSGLDKLWLKKSLRLPKNYKIILHASRIITGHKEILKEKGITNLLKSFSKLIPERQDIRLLIAIAAPPKRLKNEFSQTLEKLKGHIKLYNLEERVIYKKFKLGEMPLVYTGSDLFVLASENETFGQVYTEAMACGIPVIGTNVGGVPEIITDNYNGFLIPPNDSSILAQKIEELLYNKKLRKEFIRAGLKTVGRKFSAKRQFNILFKYFSKLLNSY